MLQFCLPLNWFIPTTLIIKCDTSLKVVFKINNWIYISPTDTITLISEKPLPLLAIWNIYQPILITLWRVSFTLSTFDHFALSVSWDYSTGINWDTLIDIYDADLRFKQNHRPTHWTFQCLQKWTMMKE